jgi:hypothetical protein
MWSSNINQLHYYNKGKGGLYILNLSSLACPSSELEVVLTHSNIHSVNLFSSIHCYIVQI